MTQLRSEKISGTFLAFNIGKGHAWADAGRGGAESTINLITRESYKRACSHFGIADMKSVEV